MGYFANGTEGARYEAEYCDRCIHRVNRDEECPVLFLHLMWNYEQCRDKLKKDTLELFIPQEGVFNGKCKMWVGKVLL